MRRNDTRGFGLFELLVLAGILAVLLLSIAPAFGRAKERARVRSTGATVLAQLKVAATLTEKTGEDHGVVLETRGVKIVNLDTGEPVAGRHQTSIAPGTRLQLAPGVDEVRFSARTGTATDTTILIKPDDGGAERVRVEVLHSGVVRLREGA